LTSAGFVPYVVRGHDPRVAKGQVSMQVPAAGAYALKGQQVVIMVSQGPLSNAVVSVPSVIGKSKSAATAALASAGCLADVSRLFSPTVPKGAVMGQLPKAGAKVAVNSDVVTVVSLGKPPAQGIVVPNVTGMVEEKAVTQLQDLGLVTVSLSGPPSTYPIGSIMAQFPKAGTKVKAGAQVVLAIAP
jgi:serine/threonine-protein kinase